LQNLPTIHMKEKNETCQREKSSLNCGAPFPIAREPPRDAFRAASLPPDSDNHFIRINFIDGRKMPLLQHFRFIGRSIHVLIDKFRRLSSKYRLQTKRERDFRASPLWSVPAEMRGAADVHPRLRPASDTRQ